MSVFESMPAMAAAITIGSAAMPFITAIFTRPGMRPLHKQLILGGLALVAGTVITILSGKVPGIPQGVLGVIGTALIVTAAIVAASQGVYRAMYGAIKAVESATSPSTPSTDNRDGGLSVVRPTTKETTR